MEDCWKWKTKQNALETNFGDCFVVEEVDTEKVAVEIVNIIKVILLLTASSRALLKMNTN